ncbi:MAG: hypothetical protein ACM31C_23420 [Acidobacteriota bacterium]
MRLPKVSILAALALAAPAASVLGAPPAAPAPRHTPAPTRATTPTPTPVPIRVAAVKPAPTKPVPVPAPAVLAVAPAAASLAAPVAADQLIFEYQRVGHEIVLLQRLRGTGAVADLWEALHEIDLDKGLATADGRANAALTFAALHDKIERRRGVQISKACQDNVITADCQ